MNNSQKGFSLVEIFVVAFIGAVLSLATYRIFFSQAKVVATSMEYMKVNDHFRKIQAFLGNDIREASMIIGPAPVRLEDSFGLVTPATGGIVLHLLKQEIDPWGKFSEGISANPCASDTFGNLVRVREIIYKLEPYKVAEEGQPKPPKRYRLIRLENIKDKGLNSQPPEQELEISDVVKEFILFRTIRKPMKALDVGKTGDYLLEPLPSHEAGTGNNLVHLNATLERPRLKESEKVYEISMTTSFYKRGKEVFFRQ